MKLAMCSLFLVGGFFAAARGGDNPLANVHPKGYVAYRATQPLKIDGKLNDRSWRAVPWTDVFVDIEGSLKPHPRFRTRVKMLWDDTYFYIGAELEEPDVCASLTKRDTVIFYDNDFEVFIDPNGDNHEYYEFEMNALNTVWDLFLPKPYKDGGSAVDSWNIEGLRTAVSVRGTLNNPADRDSGWSAEIAMPWAALKEYAHRPAPPHDGDQWRINFSRVEWLYDTADGKYQKVQGRREDNWVWSPQGVVDMHRPERWGYVQFSSNKPGTVRFRSDPTWNARCVLQEIYYAQRKFKEINKRWAGTLEELNLDSTMTASDVGRAQMQSTPEGYTATVTLQLPAGKTLRLHIRQDSLIWSD